MSLLKSSPKVLQSEKTVLAYIESHPRTTSADIIAGTGLSKYATHEAIRKLRKRGDISAVEYVKHKKTVAALYVAGIHDEPENPRDSWTRKEKKEEPEEPFIWQPHVANTKWLSCVGQLVSKTCSKAQNQAVAQLS